jgi:hypothetical protein
VVPSLGPLWERAERVDGIVSKVNRRVSLLKDALRLVAEILAMIPERREVIKSRPELRHKEGYFDNGMIQRGTEKVFLMGPPLVDGPKYTKLTQCLADRLNQCELQFHDTYNLPSEMIGEARLIKEPVWRACMEGLKMTLTWELTEAEAEARGQRSVQLKSDPGDGDLINRAKVIVVEPKQHALPPRTRRRKPRGSKAKSDELICEVLKSNDRELISKWVFANKKELAEFCGCSPGTVLKTEFWKKNRGSEQARWNRENGGRQPQRMSET